ncbi:MAG TPA: hypothetical protein VGS27_24885 [Candidatus Sulfotelmatobacter sp.]|nr:hypothetical protein [Candidatus Sulfotelmatobacter sp.]
MKIVRKSVVCFVLTGTLSLIAWAQQDSAPTNSGTSQNQPASTSTEKQDSAPQPATADKDPQNQDAKPSAQQNSSAGVQSSAGTPSIQEEQQAPATTNAEGQPVRAIHQQPKRILGVMPNYRAVSAGALPPPPTTKEAFKIATQNTFDYSSFVFVGVTSGLAFWTEAHPSIGENGMPAYWGYYWRGFLDKASGNYLVIFALPSVLHEDERYYAKGAGNGSFLGRGIYAASRILITPDYHGHNTFNTSEVLGRAMSQGLSSTYYPQADRTVGALAVKFGWAMGRDALTNVFREFWPDISVHVLHRHP